MADQTTRSKGTDYGSDVSTFVNGDLDPNFAIIEGPVVVLEQVLRMWIDAPGDMFWDEAVGEDVRSRLNAKMGEDQRLTLRWGLEATAKKHGAVMDCTVYVGMGGDGTKLEIKGQLELVTGETFDFVFDATKLTIENFSKKVSDT